MKKASLSWYLVFGIWYLDIIRGLLHTFCLGLSRLKVGKLCRRLRLLLLQIRRLLFCPTILLLVWLRLTLSQRMRGRLLGRLRSRVRQREGKRIPRSVLILSLRGRLVLFSRRRIDLLLFFSYLELCLL